MLNNPNFQNHCNHKPEEFVCAFTAFNPKKKEWEHFDLYIHNNQVCIRYGDVDSAYLSCGPLMRFLYNAILHDDYIYREALYQLKELGEFVWKSKR